MMIPVPATAACPAGDTCTELASDIVILSARVLSTQKPPTRPIPSIDIEHVGYTSVTFDANEFGSHDISHTRIKRSQPTTYS